MRRYVNAIMRNDLTSSVYFLQVSTQLPVSGVLLNFVTSVSISSCRSLGRRIIFYVSFDHRKLPCMFRKPYRQQFIIIQIHKYVNVVAVLPPVFAGHFHLIVTCSHCVTMVHIYSSNIKTINILIKFSASMST